MVCESCFQEKNSYEISASVGNLNELKKDRKNGIYFCKCIWYTASRNGHLNILKWLKKIKIPFDNNICGVMALHGHLHLLK